MTTQESLPFINITAATASEICANVYIADEPLALLRHDMTPREYLAILVEKEYYGAAIDFLAHALPPRASIWWGLLCLEYESGGSLEDWDRHAMKAAVSWVLDPSEANREDAKQPSDVLGFASPAGALAGATNQTGGSLVPPDVPPIPPSPYAPARAVAIAVKSTSNMAEALDIELTKLSYVELGIAIAEGRFLPKGLG